MKILAECQRRGHEASVFTLRWDTVEPPPAGVQLWVAPPWPGANHRRQHRFAAWVQAHAARRRAHLLVGMNKMPGLDIYYAGDPCYRQRVLHRRPWGYWLLPRCRALLQAERTVFASNTRILAISQTQISEFQRHYRVGPTRFRLLPPGLGRDRLPPPDAADIRQRQRQQMGLREDELLLLLVGSGFAAKGLDRAIRALAAPPLASKPIRLCVLGQDNAFRYRRLADTLRQSGRVQILPGTPEVQKYLLAADLLVHPARTEAGGIVLLEALVNGLPVLASGACGFAEHVRRADAGRVLAQPFRQSEFVRILALAAEDPVQRRRWSENGLAYCKTAATFDMAARAVDCIEELSPERQGRR